MMLARDLEIFCQGLSDISDYVHGFSASVSLDLHVAPVLELIPTDSNINVYKHKSLKALFENGNPKVQNELLGEFQARIREWNTVHVHGRITPQLAREVQDAMQQNEFLDSTNTIQCFRAANNAALRVYRTGDIYGSVQEWVQVMQSIVHIRSRVFSINPRFGSLTLRLARILLIAFYSPNFRREGLGRLATVFSHAFDVRVEPAGY